jgi:hypothetical protein
MRYFDFFSEFQADDAVALPPGANGSMSVSEIDRVPANAGFCASRFALPKTNVCAQECEEPSSLRSTLAN